MTAGKVRFGGVVDNLGWEEGHYFILNNLPIPNVNEAPKNIAIISYMSGKASFNGPTNLYITKPSTAIKINLLYEYLLLIPRKKKVAAGTQKRLPIVSAK
jgi:hypothetical protein